MQQPKRGYALLPVVLMFMAALATGWYIRSVTTASAQGASSMEDLPPDKPPGTGN